jgi:hypothetical protein
MANALAKHKTAAERLEALARSASNVTLIKYNSGNWTINDVTVPPDTKFVIYPDQVSHSWTHFADNKVVNEFAAVVAEDDEGDVELHIVQGQAREDLGYDDQTKWDLGSSGKPRDPWVYGFGLPMTNLKTGAAVAFKTSSVGGMGAIAGEVASFSRNRHLGYPIVTLSTSSYRNKKHGGYTSFPVFVNVGYDNPRAPTIAGRSPNGGDGSGVIAASKAGDYVITSEHAVRVDRDMDDDLPF